MRSTGSVDARRRPPAEGRWTGLRRAAGHSSSGSTASHGSHTDPRCWGRRTPPGQTVVHRRRDPRGPVWPGPERRTTTTPHLLLPPCPVATAATIIPRARQVDYSKCAMNGLCCFVALHYCRRVQKRCHKGDQMNALFTFTSPLCDHMCRRSVLWFTLL